jgi:hypothetical protein
VPGPTPAAGNHKVFYAPWLAPPQRSPTFKKQIIIGYEEESVRARKGKVRGIGNVRQSENMIVFASRTTGVPERKRLWHSGTNRGSMLSYVQLEPITACWPMPFKERKKLYGICRVAVGGRTAGSDEEDDDDEDAMCDEGDDTFDPIPPVIGTQPSKRSDENIEPFTYHSKPVTLFEELLHCFQAKGIYDLSPGDGKAAEACLLRKVKNVASASMTTTRRPCRSTSSSGRRP